MLIRLKLLCAQLLNFCFKSNVYSRTPYFLRIIIYIFFYRAAQDPENIPEDQPLSPEELKEFKQREDKLKSFMANMRLELAKLNREVLRYNTAIDEVPGTAELLQYEKRFMELYNQGKVSTYILLLKFHIFS